MIDDGSTDATARLVDGHAALHGNVRVVHQVNRGLGAARNRGLDEARGAYVTFCDADDVFLPDNHLALATDMTQAQTDVAVGTGYCLIERKTMAEFHDTPLVRLLHHLGDAPERQFMKFMLQPTACTKLFRRNYVHATGLRFTEGRLFEDVAFTTGALMHSERISFHELPLFLYDVHRSGSITSESSARRLEIFDNIAPLLAGLGRLALAPIRAAGAARIADAHRALVSRQHACSAAASLQAATAGSLPASHRGPVGGRRPARPSTPPTAGTAAPSR